MRQLTVGKEVTFTSIHSLPAGNDDTLRDLGNADVGGVDVATELLKNGWAKIKDTKREPTEDDNRRKELENEAKAGGKGIWNPHGPKVCFLRGILDPLNERSQGTHHTSLDAS